MNFLKKERKMRRIFLKIIQYQEKNFIKDFEKLGKLIETISKFDIIPNTIAR